MSEYSYDDRSRRGGPRVRERAREPEYVQETTYIERGGKGAAPVRDLVYRPAREDSIEDIPRDFPPPGAEFRQTKYRESYEPRRKSRRDFEDDYSHSEYSRGRPPREYYERDGYYSDEYDRRPKPQRRKSIVDKVKDFGEAAGIGGIIGAVTGDRSRSRSRHRGSGRDYDRGYDRGYESDGYGRRGYYDDRRSRRSSGSRSPSGRRKTEKKWEQAAKAAIVAGAVEAFRSRKTPGAWTGEKGQRIATAALGAAGIDGLVDRDPDKHSKRHIAESAIGGLLANRVANGSRSQSRGRAGSRSPDGRSRSRSRSRSLFRSLSRGRSASRGRSEEREGKDHTIRNVAGAGAVLAAGKALYDRVRSKSRSRRDRSRSVSSEDSYVPSRSRRNRDYDSRGMDQYSEAQSRANSDRRVAVASGAGAAATRDRSGGGQQERGKKDESSDSESTTDMENKRKKMRAANPYGGPPYQDGNPYGGVPPPPIGPPPGARY